MPLNEGFRLWAYSAQPYAPINSGRSLRNTVCPDIFSNALTTASFRIVPPCTTIQSPNDDKSFIFKTLCRQFFTTEYARPAAISPTEAPSRSTCLTLEFMNTVHRVPRSQGLSAKQASRANSETSCPNVREKVSIKEPQPDEHASLSSMRVSMPLSTNIAFISCPPMSRIKDTRSFSWRAAI